MKSKSRSVNKLSCMSTSGPAHELDGLAPQGQQSFTCADKSLWKAAVKHNLGRRLVSYLFARQSQPYLLVSQVRPNQHQCRLFQNQCELHYGWLGLTCKDYLACTLLYVVQQAFLLFWPQDATSSCPGGCSNSFQCHSGCLQLSHSASFQSSFQTIWPGF